jgi:hypothetical protein
VGRRNPIRSSVAEERSCCLSRSRRGQARSTIQHKSPMAMQPPSKAVCVAVKRAGTACPGFRPVLRRVRACLSEARQHSACPQRDKRGSCDKPRPAKHGPMTSIASSCMRLLRAATRRRRRAPKNFPFRCALLLPPPSSHPPRVVPNRSAARQRSNIAIVLVLPVITAQLHLFVFAPAYSLWTPLIFPTALTASPSYPTPLLIHTTEPHSHHGSH